MHFFVFTVSSFPLSLIRFCIENLQYLQGWSAVQVQRFERCCHLVATCPNRGCEIRGGRGDREKALLGWSPWVQLRWEC